MRVLLLLSTCIALAAIGCGGSGRTAVTVAHGVKLQRIGVFHAPVYLTSPPGDRHQLFVVEQQGTIRLVRDGHEQAKPFLDIRSQVLAGGERGLLSMAFAPDYAKSGLYYVYYTGRDGDIHIQEFPTRRELVRIEHSTYPNHNGGQLQFGPDGRLYAGTGDGGKGGDPFRNAQNPKRLLGKILRFDAARRHPSVYAIGFRNPWRFSFDRLTNDVVIGDVGQDKYEEIDFVPRGGLRGRNFGWSKREGFHDYYGGAVKNYVPPVIERTHSQGNCSITGGYVVRDKSVPDLYGRYVYGDFCQPDIRAARLRPGHAVGDRAIGLRVPALSSFGQDAAGHVYALSLNGPVYRFVAG